jgi:DNA-binding MarR family transcriptional regulator
MIEKKILLALDRIHTAIKSALQHASSTSGLSPLQVQILHYVHCHDGANISKLAQYLRVSKPTISDSVSTLVSKQLLQKVADTHDARGTLLTITPQGAQEAQELDTYISPFLDAIGALPADNQTHLWDGLLLLVRMMEERELIPPMKMCFSCDNYSCADGTQHYCRLLQQYLAVDELRIDCPEHKHS